MNRFDKGERLLRFAVMCRGTIFPTWQAKCIRYLIESGVAKPALLVIESRTDAQRSAAAARGPTSLAGMLYGLYESQWLRPRLQAMRPVDLAQELGAVPAIACVAQRQENGQAIFCAADVAAIRGHDLDFILQFAFDGIAGDVLTAARFGTWIYNHGAGRGRTELAAFWGLYRGDPLYPFALSRADRDAAGADLHRGCFGAARSHATIIDRMLLGAADWCARVARQIAFAPQQQPLVCLDSPATKVAAEGVPRTGEFLVFLIRRAVALARGAFRHFFLLECWNIAVVDAPIDQVLTDGQPKEARWLAPSTATRYYADPFALPDAPEAILVEEYCHRRGKGWLSVLQASSDGMIARPIASLEGEAHRSYPFLICDNGAIFCIPESAEDRRVELYRAVSFPERWERVSTLIEDFPALDSTVMRHDGRWWLFCTSGAEGGEYKLYAWHAEALGGPWRPHSLNPLKCDVSSSRPAGRPFVIDGELYRPAQDGSRTYGGAVTVNRILRLTPTEFEEAMVGSISPAPDSAYPDGLHTVCPLGCVTIIDGKRFVFDVRAFFIKTRSFARKRREMSEGAAMIARPALDLMRAGSFTCPAPPSRNLRPRMSLSSSLATSTSV
jgi:hypothetical protein